MFGPAFLIAAFMESHPHMESSDLHWKIDGRANNNKYVMIEIGTITRTGYAFR